VCFPEAYEVVVQVSSYKKVRKVVFVESIPRSPAGKILRRLLMDSLRECFNGFQLQLSFETVTC
jgi:acyl-coenzyme A synthetase/AMP-(fatty) acid ligase